MVVSILEFKVRINNILSLIKVDLITKIMMLSK